VPSVGSRPQGVGVADFNRDGHLDLAVARESGNGLTLYTGKAGAIVQARSLSGLADLNVLTIGDFNLDGWPDVAAASSSGSRVSGWGWGDDGWGAPNVNGVMLRFSAGFQSMTIQTREDGVSIDQVVLSSNKYATTSPGPAKNDATILPYTFSQER
jgi:hypothetical protein